MTPATLVVGLALAVVLLVQAIQRRQDRRAAEHAQHARDQSEADARVAANPRAHIQYRTAQRQSALVGPTHLRNATERELAAAVKDGEALLAPEWKGARLIARFVALGLLPVLVIASVILNCEIFAALNSGVSTATLLKGTGASVLELLLSLYIADLFLHRRTRALDWQLRVAMTLCGLVLVVGFVAVYAPARSAQASQHAIALDKVVLQEAKSADAADPTANTAIAVTAASQQLATDEARLHKAETSDAAQSVAFPAFEVLIGELALEGVAAVVVIGRRHRHRRRVLAAQAARDAAAQAVDQVRADHELQVTGELQRAGVLTLPRGGPALPPGSQPAPASGPAGAAPSPAPAPGPQRTPIREQPRTPHPTIDLRDFPPPEPAANGGEPAQQADATPRRDPTVGRWDLTD